jgi:hypothetical protein
VNQLKALLAAGLLALWMPATSFCLLENAGLLAKNDGCCNEQSSEEHPCCVLASAVYKMDESGAAMLPSLPQLLAVSTDLATLDCSARHLVRVAECGVSPPELSASWQFSSRAALAPRAP